MTYIININCEIANLSFPCLYTAIICNKILLSVNLPVTLSAAAANALEAQRQNIPIKADVVCMASGVH